MVRDPAEAMPREEGIGGRQGRVIGMGMGMAIGEGERQTLVGRKVRSEREGAKRGRRKRLLGGLSKTGRKGQQLAQNNGNAGNSAKMRNVLVFLLSFLLRVVSSSIPYFVPSIPYVIRSTRILDVQSAAAHVAAKPAEMRIATAPGAVCW